MNSQYEHVCDNVQPPRIRVSWKQSVKGILSFECTWEGTGEYTQEERDIARRQAIDESDLLCAELLSRSALNSQENE